MDNLFFELIHVVVGKCTCLSHTPSTKEWKEIYALAYNHALLGVCFRSLNILDKQEQLSQLPLQLKMQWLGMAVQILKRNELMNQRCVELQRRMSERKESIRINGNLSGIFILRLSDIGALIIGLGSGARYTEYVDLFGEK